MKRILPLFLFISCFTVLAQNQNEPKSSHTSKVKLVTTHGVILLKLYNETPLHRDNFIKIVNDGVLDSLLFHRVIENFMIQTGDTGSKHSKPGDTLGSGDLAYTVPSEITTQYFHKKGVLAAARGDTPERESSSTQFYIVQGKILNDSLLTVAEKRINGWLAEYYIKHDSKYRNQLDSLNVAMKSQDWNTYSRINTKFRELAKTYSGFETYKIPEAHREIYKTIGGTPHLDQNYTVFGEVISGLEVVDSIAAEKTNDLDRPLKDVRILSAIIIEEN
jgi:peptidyl-prolyl cis-trans isomerase B (cyclophilin B)